MAAELGIHQRDVWRHLDRAGVERRPPLDRETLIRLYVDERLGIRRVAGRLGVSPGTVKRDLAHHGIPIRRPGRPRNLAGHEPVS